MLKQFWATCMLLFMMNSVYGTELSESLKGKVKDSKTRKALEFVNIAVRSKQGDDFFKGAVTDSDGVFVISNIPDGSYELTISFLGYESYTKEISVEQSVIDLSDIFLTEDAKMLSEVNVTAQKQAMRFEIDKKVFNVDQNLTVVGGVASDILTNIPSVEVDADGEVSLRGNSSVTVWINGKASGLSDDNRAQILEQLPAESIERIEVITNPSAKFSPEGTSGIINIILKEKTQEGYYGGAQVGIDTYGAYNLSGNINYSIKKWEFLGNIGTRQRQRRNGSNTYQEYFNADNTTTYLSQNSKGKSKFDNIFGRFGVTYHLTSQDQFSLNGFLMHNKGNSNTPLYYHSDIPTMYLSSERHSESDSKMNGGNLEFGYRHEFTERSFLDFSASYNRFSRDQDATYLQISSYANNTTGSSYQLQTSEMDRNGSDIQLDYENRLSEIYKLELGYKGSFSYEKSPIETLSGTSAENATPTYSLYNTFIYDQDIHAMYATFSGKIFSKLGYQLGLRGEHTRLKTRSPGYEEDNDPAYRRNYTDFFPSMYLTYVLPSENEVQLNYSRRVARPWGRQLNPFKNITDSTSISYGNPFLKSEFTNSFELNYIKTWEKHTISFSGYYRSTENVIQPISYKQGNVMMRTFDNITKSQSTGLELVAKNKIFSICDITTSLNLFMFELDGFDYQPEDAPLVHEGSSNDFTWNVRSIANVKLPKAFTCQVTINYNAKQLISQGYRKANYSVDAGVKKQINEHWSVNANCRDLFDTRRWHSITSGEGYRVDSENWRGGRRAQITVAYNFGNMRFKKSNENSQSSDSNEDSEMSDYE